MGMDAFVLNAVAAETDEKIVRTGGRVGKIYQLNPAEIVLHFRGEKGLEVLFVSVDPSGARIHLAEDHHSPPPAPPSFCMLLRKHLHRGRLVSISQPPLERVLYLNFTVRDPSSREVPKTLAVEIMGRHSNLVLLDSPGQKGEQRILGAVKNIPPAINRYRTILPNHFYLPPPAQQKLHPFALNYEYFKEEMSQLEGQSAPKALLKTLQGLSPFLAQEIAVRAGVEEVHRSTLPLLWDGLHEILSLYDRRSWEPFLVLDSNGTPVDFCAFKPRSLPGNSFLRPSSSMSKTINDFFHYKEKEEARKRLYQYLENRLKQSLKKLRKKEKLQLEELEKTRRAGHYRLCGELILANLNEIPPQSKEVHLKNLYHENGEEVKVLLDPSAAPTVNAQRYFKKYRKAKQGAEKIGQQLKHTRSDIEYLESVLFSLEKSSMRGLHEVKKELEETGFLPQPKTGEHPPKKKQEEKKGVPSPPLRFISSAGEEIHVGRNNRQNEYLVKHFSSKEDCWLHAKNTPGAHVIIKSEAPHEKTLLEAALLAAYFSRSAHSSNVPVDYTRVKNLARHPGKKPGMVTYRNHGTIFVTPSEDALKHLLEQVEYNKT